MKLRAWYGDHILITGLLLSVILALTVGNIYVNLSQDIIFDLGFDELPGALISVAVRFLISAIALYIIVPYLFYQQ